MSGIVRGLLGLAMLASLAVGLGTHVGWDLPLASQDLSTVALIDAADQDVSTAIQQVIQRSNDEQAQAIAARDTSVMADTLTAERYQQMAQINQRLLDGGVWSIELVRIEWGQISVDGGTATASTFETWRTILADGTAEQSRDINAYRLVLDAASGAWKIAADEHPRTAAGAGAGNPAPDQPPPGLAADQSLSHNWSGYAATGGSFTAIAATWTVPRSSSDGAPFGADATWVGIGGVRSRDLIQAGTQQTVSASGRADYAAWIETLPRASRPVPLAVHPGDSVTVALVEQSPDEWLITFSNATTGQTFETTQAYHSSHASAEWVEEAPSGERGILPLDNFGAIQFTNASAVKDGQAVSVADSGAWAITLLGAADQVLAVPSGLGRDGASFSIARTATASTATGATSGPAQRTWRRARGD